MLLQTNSYIVPKEKRAEHARLVRRFRQALARLGCEQFEVFEQAGNDWSTGDSTGRFVQIMHFRDKKHQLAVQAAEHSDPNAQAIIKEFCELINFPYQMQQGLFAVGFYSSVVTPSGAALVQQHEEEGAVAAGEAGPPEELKEEALLEATQQASEEILAEGVETEGQQEPLTEELSADAMGDVEPAGEGVTEGAEPEVQQGEQQAEEPHGEEPRRERPAQPNEIPRW